MTIKQKSLIMCMATGMIFGIVPVMTLRCYEYGATEVWLLIARSAFMLLFLGPRLLKTMSIKKVLKENWKELSLLALSNSFTDLFIYSAYKYMASSVVVTLHFIYPALVVVICMLFYKEKITKVQAICLVLCTVGIFLTLDISLGLNLTGIILSVLSAICYSAYIVLLGKINIPNVQGESLLLFVGIGNILVGGIPYGIITHTLAMPLSINLVWNILWTQFVIFIADMLFAKGIKGIGPQTAAIISTFEPLVGIVIGIVFLKDAFSLFSIVGALMILLSAVIISINTK